MRRQAFLAEASALLISSFDPDAILRQLARMAVPQIADCCLADLVGDDRTAVRRVAYVHVDPGTPDIAWEDARGMPRSA